jgi:very-short-patch-repair endonuclease
MHSSEIDKKLLSSRKELLDISLRNNMLNLQLRKNNLRIMHGLSADILKILYIQNKPATFIGTSEQNTEEATLKSSELNTPNLQNRQNSHSENETQYLLEQLNVYNIFPQTNTCKTRKRYALELQINFTVDALWLSLLKIQTNARTYIQEQGVNVLFLTLGCLHWFDIDTPNILRKAPLLFIPVQLKRNDKDGFYLECTGDDLFENDCLALKLKTDFNISLPKYFKNENNEDLPDLATFFSQIEESIQSQNQTKKTGDWLVDTNEIYLGFFSFGKFLMFNDLDVDKWPAHKNPCEHPILRHLLGGYSASLGALPLDNVKQNTLIKEDIDVDLNVDLDTVLTQTPLHLVTDADSSQIKAILKARSTNNLIIQGPPGTGKSQTITNIIADCLAQHKTVLFVSEKMAALDVVKNRLDAACIGNAVLELHSHKTRKQTVLEEIGKNLNNKQAPSPPPLNKNDGEIKLEFSEVNLKQIQNDLKQYCQAVNMPIGQSGTNFIDALGHYLKLKHVLYGESSQVEHWDLSHIQTYTQQNYKQQLVCIQDMALHLEKMGVPSKHIFWGSNCEQFSPADRTQIEQLFFQSIEQLLCIQQASTTLAKNLDVREPLTLMDAHLLCETAQRLFDFSHIEGIDIHAIDWMNHNYDIQQLIHAGKAMQALRQQYQPMFIDAAWQQNLLQDRQNLAYYGDKWWRNLSGAYRNSLSKLKGLCKEPLLNLKDCNNHLSLIDAIFDFQKYHAIYMQHMPKGKQLFVDRWKGVDSNWLELEKIYITLSQLHIDVANNKLPQHILQALQQPLNIHDIKKHVLSIQTNYTQLQVNILQLEQKLNLNMSAHAATMHMNDLNHQLNRYCKHLDGIYDIARFNQLHKKLLDIQLQEAAEQATNWARPAQDFVRLFNFSWYDALIMIAYDANAYLREFNRSKHEDLIKQFKYLDEAALHNTQYNLAKYIYAQDLHKNQGGEVDILHHELHKKRRHMSIRQLLTQAGRAIQKIKPIFMMSPMSIANFLAPGELEFDVVIFDEASQVKTVDALGAILRGRQVIVVGDTQQMPPSDFFNRDVEIDDNENITNDIESILSMFRARGVQECYLNWHYRSQDPSLIAVSNTEFYNNQLLIFPSPQHSMPKVSELTTTATSLNLDLDLNYIRGLSLQYMPHAIYDKGNTKTNIEEAKAVAQAVLMHAIHNFHLSLGVIAFSIAQRDLIQLELEILRQNNAKLNLFLNNTHTDSNAFFIKNLENVQGDERDVIFVSIGYGRNASGSITQNFGPLNYQGGERRLNVLMTRAKLAMRVFCNFHAHELHVDEATKHGIHALKHFLHYAETRVLYPRNTSNIETKSIKTSHSINITDKPFEYMVMQALQKQGYIVDANVGISGYFIDLAIKDPQNSTHYILGIVFDGENYHSAHSTRDRDRLLPHILSKLGWYIHRIWSTDWLRHPQRELDLIVAAIDAAHKENIEKDKHTQDKNIYLPETLEIAETLIGENVENVEDVENTANINNSENTHNENLIQNNHNFNQKYNDNTVDIVINNYQVADLSQQFSAPLQDIYNTPTQALLEYIQYILNIEAPIHEQLLSKRLLSFYGLARSGSRIAAKISEALLIGVAQAQFFYAAHFIYITQENNVIIRKRLNLNATDRKIEWIAHEEIDILILSIVNNAFSIKTEKIFLLILNHLGLGKLTPKIKDVLTLRIEYLVTHQKLLWLNDVLSLVK